MSIRIRQQLLQILGKVNRPGTFCTSGRLPPTLPGLEVAGVGPVALPLEKRQAAALKKRAHQAPYGKGTQTLVDTDVRRVWEIDADQVVLANPEWADVLKQAVRTVETDLGLERQKLDAHLYKLLLYEPGSFFLAHRDGEKLDRMVATLVIALPSPHEGGELVVRHEGREVLVDFGPQSAFQTQFAAFYADCEHEIRPVRSGFRLTLVYNLTLKKSKQRITAPTSGEHVAAAARLLRQWASRQDAGGEPGEDGVPSKLAVLLGHKYTEAGLSRDALKGIDRARADVLFAAAREAGCDASLALVTYWEVGDAEEEWGYSGYGRYDEEYDEEDDAAGEHEMGEVIDSSLTAEQFRDAENQPLAYGQIPLDENEIVSEEPLQEGEPDREEFEGYTGNEGMTLERWYHRAAVVLWPAGARFDILCEAGVAAAVGGLEQMVRRWRQAGKDEQETLKQDCLDFARRIIAHWPERPFAHGLPVDDSYLDYGEEDDPYQDYEDEDDEGFEDEDEDAVADEAGDQPGESESKAPPRLFLTLLQELGDVSLISAWIRGVLARDAAVDPGPLLGDVCRQYGWATFQDELRELFANTANETLERHARLLTDFALRKDKNADRKRVCSELAEQLVSAVERWDPLTARRDWQARVVNRRELLSLLTQALLALGEPTLLDRLVTYVLDRPRAFDLTTVQVPALLDLEPWLKRNLKRRSAPLHRWLTALAGELETRASHPPLEPTDWRRESNTGCTCVDCQALRRFLKDPNAQTLRLPLAEPRRRHLHQVIDGRKLDTTHVTERRGRPYTLVCTKTKGSYERALEAHHVDLDQLANVRRLLK
jgi:hypothetical protein